MRVQEGNSRLWIGRHVSRHACHFSSPVLCLVLLVVFVAWGWCLVCVLVLFPRGAIVDFFLTYGIGEKKLQLPWLIQGFSSWCLLELKTPVHMARMGNTVHHRLGHGLQHGSLSGPMEHYASVCSTENCFTRIRRASAAACKPLRYLPGQAGRPSLDRVYSPAC